MRPLVPRTATATRQNTQAATTETARCEEAFDASKEEESTNRRNDIRIALTGHIGELKVWHSYKLHVGLVAFVLQLHDEYIPVTGAPCARVEFRSAVSNVLNHFCL